MNFRIKAVLFNEQFSGFLPDAARHFNDINITHCRADILNSLLISKISNGSMTCIDGKEFAFNVSGEIVDYCHTFNLRSFTDKTFGINVPFTELFDFDQKFFIVVLRRYYSVNCCIWEAD